MRLFYRLFDNITDVLSYLCDNSFESAGRKYEKMSDFNSKETSLMFIKEWMNNKTLLKAIVDCNRMDFLFNAHLKYLGNNVDFFFPNLSMSKEQFNYLLMTTTFCTASCLVAWIRNGAYETAEQLQSRLGNCLKTIYNIFI